VNTVKVSIVKGFRQLAAQLSRWPTAATCRLLRGLQRSLIFTVAAFFISAPAAGDIKTDALIKAPEPAALTPSRASSPTGKTPGALYRQARAYDAGQGVAQDHSRARDLYLEAAEAGHVDAMLSAGLMLSQGQGGPADHRAAANWLKRAAEQGSSDGQYSLGVLHMQGAGVAKSYAQATRWFLRAARSGHAQAMNNLGVLHAAGLLGEKDPVRAFAWFSLGAEAGSSDAADNKVITEDGLSLKQRADGDALANKLRADTRQ
jgi:TPR repeat protein